MSTAVATEVVCPEVKVGDFFVSSWGYDQTNVDYYKVVGRTAKTIKLQPWQGAVEYTEGFGSQDKVTPGGGPATYHDWSACDGSEDYWERQEKVQVKPKPVLTKRLREYSDRASVSIASYANAYHWKGEAAYQTAQGFGH